MTGAVSELYTAEAILVGYTMNDNLDKIQITALELGLEE